MISLALLYKFALEFNTKCLWDLYRRKCIEHNVISQDLPYYIDGFTKWGD